MYYIKKIVSSYQDAEPSDEDIVIASCKTREMIPYELSMLKLTDAKTRLSSSGTLLYQKGASTYYVHYVK